MSSALNFCTYSGETPPDDPVQRAHWLHPGKHVPRRAYIDRWYGEFENRRFQLDPRELKSIRDQIEAKCEGWQARCDMEEQLADHIRRIAPRAKDRDLGVELRQLADKMYDCHQRGPIIKSCEEVHVAWHAKCGKVRTCPHEAREETQRLAEHYVPELTRWADASESHRLQYAVFTTPNAPPGGLQLEKVGQFELFKRWMKKQAAIVGALVVQEDPLSVHDDWNVHLNVILMVNGDFDWKTARELWGFDIHFTQVDAKHLVNTMLELVKYSAKFTAAPGDKHTDAPPMVEWSAERFIEWYQAQKGYRRTRSYGLAFAIDGKRWNNAQDALRRQWAEEAHTYDLRVSVLLAVKEWKELPQFGRDAIRQAMIHGERFEIDDAYGIGAVSRHVDGSFLVDLVPGDNSTEKSTTGQLYRAGAPP